MAPTFCIIHHQERTLNSLESPSLIVPILAFRLTYIQSWTWTFNSGMGGSDVE